VPFFYILFEYTKRNGKLLAAISFWVLGMHILDTYVTIMPFLHQKGFELSVLDLLALLSIGPLLAFIFILRLGGVSLFPARDPRLLESLKLSN
jgi:hypothetical protein